MVMSRAITKTTGDCMNKLKKLGIALLAGVSSIGFSNELMGQTKDLGKDLKVKPDVAAISNSTILQGVLAEKAAKYDSIMVAKEARKDGTYAELEFGTYGGSMRLFQPTNIGNTEVEFFAGAAHRFGTRSVESGTNVEVGMQSKRTPLFKGTAIGTLGLYGAMEMFSKRVTGAVQARLSRPVYEWPDKAARLDLFAESNLVVCKQGLADGMGKLIFDPKLAFGLKFKFGNP